MTSALLVARVSTVEKGQDPENKLVPPRHAAHRLAWGAGGGRAPAQRAPLLSLFSGLANWESTRRSERLKAGAATRRHRAGDQGRAAWGRGKMATPADVLAARGWRDRGRR